MNLNEVIAGRANEILTGNRGGKSPVHPNDHVNKGQSSNDTIPTTIRVAALIASNTSLKPALTGLHKALLAQSESLAGISKIGRTHLQDAVPITLGQEFAGYARQVELGLARVEQAETELSELPLGGTAVGTGLGTHPEFAARVIDGLNADLGLAIREAKNHFEVQGAQDGIVAASGSYKAVAVSLSKIANDIRLLASGPRAGLGELNLPRLQPGSSIMPGKVNPVVSEAVIQASAQVIGYDAAICLGGLGGYFELNTMLPLMAHNLLGSIQLLAGAARLLNEKCVTGLTANIERCRALIEGSLALSTYLVPEMGYDRAAAVAEEAYQTGRTVRQVVLDQGLLSEEETDKLFDQASNPDEA